MEKCIQFEKQTLKKKTLSMLKIDFRRMFTQPLFYIMAGISFVIPILILIMTTLMDGSVTSDPQTGVQTVIEGFKNVWEIIGSVSGGEASQTAGMGITAMCNINLLYFGIATFVCLFVASDFKSGYAKNLFTVRAKRTDYVISKTIVLFVAGAIMIGLFFIGAMIGGAISGLSFALEGVNAFNIVMCLLSKMLIVGVFVPMFIAVSVWAKDKSWLSILCAVAASALLFMMIPMVTPLNSGIMNVILCLAGSAMFSIGLGAVSRIILKKSSIL